ncbi:putative Zinc finger protein, partial [Daphnia magna]
YCTLDIKGTVVRPFKFNGSIAHKAYVEFIVTNSHAFTLGEEPAFRKFLLLLQHLYKPLGATAVKARIMKAFVELKFQVMAKLGNCNLALTVL